MKRREFFRYAAATTVVPGLTALPSPASAQTWITSALDRTRLPASIPPAAPALDAAFRDLLARMDRLGWSPFLLSVAGFDLGKAISSEGELFRELPVPTDPALSEFAGRRAIQPGDPAMSLLW